ncbi:MAG TPA: stalk domain-containing protein [Caldisericia bacterium]|nr:stalk domain-containing protein [Caldisericia bacterium]HPF49762.1 stalk domain-containing protein [Caldisericia bacterium]HPI84323.1 stalk domain-containing protein [Caldisericia bacterium]HPQ93750.1 stalk domain-containing protein [Caldisericia bacterium]HRV74826.1 stalk domain-containing protein [Caldisericia bacterium]
MRKVSVWGFAKVAALCLVVFFSFCVPHLKNSASSFDLQWPQAYPDSRGNCNANVFIPEGAPQVAWSHTLSDTTAAVVTGDQIFLGVAKQAVCFSLESGEREWIVQMPGKVLAPPAVVAGRAIFTDDNGSVVSIDIKTGELKNRFSVAHRIEAAPVILGSDVLVASTSGFLYLLTPDLHEKFSADLDAPLYTSPIVTNQGLMQLNGLGKLFTLNPKTGEILDSKLTLAQDRAIQPNQNTGFVNLCFNNKVMRYQGETEFDINLAGNATCATSITSQNQEIDGRLFVGTTNKLCCYDADELVWAVDVSTPVTAISTTDEIVFFGTEGGALGAHKITDGEFLWADSTSGKVNHPIVLLDKGLVVSGANSLSFRQLWNITIEPDTVDLGHVPTGEVAKGTFTVKNPIDSPGAIKISARSESPLVAVHPMETSIEPGAEQTYEVTLESEGDEEGRYYTTVTLTTPTAIYRVTISYYIVPQPFIANLQIGNATMKMQRGSASWDVTLDHPPYIKNDRTMVPLRAISESFGPKVDYDKYGCTDKALVVITLGDTIINHCIGTNVLDISVAGSPPEILTFDTSSEIKNDRTFVPIRFIAEAFDAVVGWIQESKTVTITYQP